MLMTNTDRYLRAIFVGLIGLTALFFFLQNTVNSDVSVEVVRGVITLQGHEKMPNNFFPALPSFMAGFVLAFLMTGELLSGVFCLYGSFRLFGGARDAAKFARGLPFAKIGAGLVFMTWYGSFITIGGSAFQMWQTPGGHVAWGDAAVISSFGLLALIYLGQGSHSNNLEQT